MRRLLPLALLTLAACQQPQPAPVALSLNLICLPGTYQGHPAMGCQGEAMPRDGVGK